MIYDITPYAKPRMVSSDRWKKRPAVLKYWAYKAECIAKGIEPRDEQSIIFLMPMPKSWSNKKKERMQGQPHRQRPDLDNLLKGLWDILPEDSHIASVTACKKWAHKGQIIITNQGG